MKTYGSKKNPNLIVISHKEFHALSDVILLRIRVIRMNKKEVHLAGKPQDIKTIKTWFGL